MTRDTLTVYVEEEYRRQSQLLMDLREATLAEIDRLCQSDYIKSSFFRMFQQLNQSVTFRQSSTEMIIEEVVKTYHSLSEDLKNLSHFMSKSEHLTSVTYPQIKTGMEVGVTKLTTYEVCAIPRKIDQIESKDHEMTMVYEVLLTGRFAKERMAANRRANLHQSAISSPDRLYASGTKVSCQIKAGCWLFPNLWDHIVASICLGNRDVLFSSRNYITLTVSKVGFYAEKACDEFGTTSMLATTNTGGVVESKNPIAGATPFRTMCWEDFVKGLSRQNYTIHNSVSYNMQPYYNLQIVKQDFIYYGPIFILGGVLKDGTLVLWRDGKLVKCTTLVDDFAFAELTKSTLRFAFTLRTTVRCSSALFLAELPLDELFTNSTYNLMGKSNRVFNGGNRAIRALFPSLAYSPVGQIEHHNFRDHTKGETLCSGRVGVVEEDFSVQVYTFYNYKRLQYKPTGIPTVVSTATNTDKSGLTVLDEVD